MASGNATNAIILRRLTALEAEITALKAENTALKSNIPLAAVAAGLSTASSEDVALWMEVCKAVADKYGELASIGPAAENKPKKVKKVKSNRKVTNPTGPTEWNLFVQNVWIDMAEAAGVSFMSIMEGVDENDLNAVTAADKKFKAAAAEKGVTYQAVLTEASRRKDEEAGVDHAAKMAEKLARKQKKVSGTVAPPSKKVTVVTDEEAELLRSMKEAGFTVKVVGGQRVWIEEATKDVFVYGEGADLGDLLGVYDPDTDSITNH